MPGFLASKSLALLAPKRKHAGASLYLLLRAPHQKDPYSDYQNHGEFLL